MKIKLSNKILLGGFLFPIVLFIGLVIYFSANSTENPEFQLGNKTEFLGQSYN